MKQLGTIIVRTAHVRGKFMASLLIALVTAMPAVAAQPVRVACVGDSITSGHGIANPKDNSYPALLAKSLGEEYEVRNFGKSGASVLKRSNRPYWTQPEFAAAQEFAPNVVIFMLGTNDTQPVNWKPHYAEFSDDCVALITAFRTLESKPRVIVCLPPPLFRDRGKDWDTDALLHDEILPRIRQLAARESLPVIDFYKAFAGSPELLPDGVHPNAEGAKLITDCVEQAIKNLPSLAERSPSARSTSPRKPRD